MSLDQEQFLGRKPEELKFNGLLLKEAQLQVGMRVVVVLEGCDTLELGPHGCPIILQVLERGVPAHKELYPVVTGAARGSSQAETKILNKGFRRFRQNVRFMPTEVFLPSRLPYRGKFMVFENGEPITYNQDSTTAVVVVTDEHGRRFLDRPHLGRVSCSLPKNLLLVKLYRPEELEGLIPISER